METLIWELQGKKNGEKYHDGVIEDAIFHLKKSMECLDEGLQDPKKWYEDNVVIAKTFTQLFPVIYRLQQIHSIPQIKESSQEDRQ